jgi:DNA topoisomerase-3
LGTEATRAGIIEQLLKRNFIALKGKQLRATELASDIVDALPVQLTEPGMTALWEQALDEVSAGKMKLEDFLGGQVKWTKQLVAQGLQQHVNIRIPPTPPCPLCGGKTRKRQGEKSAFWSCQRYPACKGVINIEGAKKSSRSGAKPAKRKPN